MEKKIKVAITGDYNPNYSPHVATSDSIMHVAEEYGVKTSFDWIETPRLEENPADTLKGYSHIWASPAPYKSKSGILNAINYARTNMIPFIGTCGGLMYSIAEFCLNELKLDGSKLDIKAENQENQVLISDPCCSHEFYDIEINIEKNLKTSLFYPKSYSYEISNCGFSVNKNHYQMLNNAGLVVAATDNSGDAKIFELEEHPFFILTKFLPQLLSSEGKPHPLIFSYLTSNVMEEISEKKPIE